MRLQEALLTYQWGTRLIFVSNSLLKGKKCLHPKLYSFMYIYVYMYRPIYMGCVFLCSHHPLCNKFVLRFRSQFVFRVPLPPRLNFLYGFSPFSSCSSPSPFPSFHNLFSDLYRPSCLKLTRELSNLKSHSDDKEDTVLEQAQDAQVCSENSVLDNAKNKSACISWQRWRVMCQEI